MGKEIDNPSFPNNIPPVDNEEYQSVRDAKHWKNPHLIIRPNGVEVLNVDDLVAPKEIGRVLASLPIDAWPYGSVIAVQEIGIVSGNDDEKIHEVLAEVLATLNALNIEVSRWPH